MNFLNYRKKKFYIDNISIEKLSKKFKTPFYCYSLSQVKLNLDHLKNSFNKIKPLICFSVKSNSNIKILNELKKKGCGADVVSMGEMLAALKAGVHPSKIVFSGVGKTKEELEFAIKSSPIDTTSAPHPSFFNSLRIFKFELDFIEKQINGFIL